MIRAEEVFGKERDHLMFTVLISQSQLQRTSLMLVFLYAKINNKICDTLVDSGAGPCVIHVAILKEWNLFKKIKLREGGRSLYGLSISKIIGTIVLKVQLH